MQDTPSRKLEQYIVRFPDGMRDKLKQRAAENNRSMNQEIVARLERTFAQDAREHLSDVFQRVQAGEFPQGVRIGPAKSAPDEREEDVTPWRHDASALPDEFVKQLDDLKSMIHRQTDVIFMQTDLMRSIVGEPRSGSGADATFDPVAALERLAAEVRDLRSSIVGVVEAPAEPAGGDEPVAMAKTSVRGIKPPKGSQ